MTLESWMAHYFTLIFIAQIGLQDPQFGLETVKYFNLTQNYFLNSILCVIECSCHDSSTELTLDIFYSLFPWNEEHNEIFELSFHLSKKLLNRVIKKMLFNAKKSLSKTTADDDKLYLSVKTSSQPAGRLNQGHKIQTVLVCKQGKHCVSSGLKLSDFRYFMCGYRKYLSQGRSLGIPRSKGV